MPNTKAHFYAVTGNLSALETEVAQDQSCLVTADNIGSTPFSLACISGHTALVEYMLSKEKYADIFNSNNISIASIIAHMLYFINKQDLKHKYEEIIIKLLGCEHELLKADSNRLPILFSKFSNSTMTKGTVVLWGYLESVFPNAVKWLEGACSREIRYAIIRSVIISSDKDVHKLILVFLCDRICESLEYLKLSGEVCEIEQRRLGEGIRIKAILNKLKAKKIREEKRLNNSLKPSRSQTLSEKIFSLLGNKPCEGDPKILNSVSFTGSLSNATVYPLLNTEAEDTEEPEESHPLLNQQRNYKTI